jgi:hypothetical protein
VRTSPPCGKEQAATCRIDHRRVDRPGDGEAAEQGNVHTSILAADTIPGLVRANEHEAAKAETA